MVKRGFSSSRASSSSTMSLPGFRGHDKSKGKNKSNLNSLLAITTMTPADIGILRSGKNAKNNAKKEPIIFSSDVSITSHSTISTTKTTSLRSSLSSSASSVSHSHTIAKLWSSHSNRPLLHQNNNKSRNHLSQRQQRLVSRETLARIHGRTEEEAALARKSRHREKAEERRLLARSRFIISAHDKEHEEEEEQQHKICSSAHKHDRTSNISPTIKKQVAQEKNAHDSFHHPHPHLSVTNASNKQPKQNRTSPQKEPSSSNRKTRNGDDNFVAENINQNQKKDVRKSSILQMVVEVPTPDDEEQEEEEASLDPSLARIKENKNNKDLEEDVAACPILDMVIEVPSIDLSSKTWSEF